MPLTKATKTIYDAVVSAVPDYPGKFWELHAPGSLYYKRQYVFDPAGQLVAFHDDADGGGLRWADISQLTKDSK